MIGGCREAYERMADATQPGSTIGSSEEGSKMIGSELDRIQRGKAACEAQEIGAVGTARSSNRMSTAMPKLISAPPTTTAGEVAHRASERRLTH